MGTRGGRLGVLGVLVLAGCANAPLAAVWEDTRVPPDLRAVGVVAYEVVLDLRAEAFAYTIRQVTSGQSAYAGCVRWFVGHGFWEEPAPGTLRLAYHDAGTGVVGCVDTRANEPVRAIPAATVDLEYYLDGALLTVRNPAQNLTQILERRTF